MHVIDAKVGFWLEPAYWHPGYYPETTRELQQSFLPPDFVSESQSVHPQFLVYNQLHSRIELGFLKNTLNEIPENLGMVLYIDHRSDDFAFLLQEAQEIPNIQAYQLRLNDQDSVDQKFQEALWYIGEQQKAIEIWCPLDLVPSIANKVSGYEAPIIIDQFGNPDIRNGRMLKWQNALATLAMLPNMYLKVSGLLTLAHWQYWQNGDILPYWIYAQKVFGNDRLIFGSDWPYLRLSGAYNDAINLIYDLHKVQAVDLDAFFFGNAKHVYKL